MAAHRDFISHYIQDGEFRLILTTISILLLPRLHAGTIPDLSSLLKLTYLAIANTKITEGSRCDLIIPKLPLGITKIDYATCNEGSLQILGVTWLSVNIPLFRQHDHRLRYDSNPRTTRAHFTGSIPPEIGALVALTTLYLQGTKVEGASGLIQIS